MKLSSVINKAYNTQWSFTNNFSVQIKLPPTNTKMQNLQFIKYNEELSMFIKNIDLPDIQAEAIESWVVDRYRMGMGPDQPYRFSITFLDSNNVELWRSFLEQYSLTKNNYFDNQKLSISVYKESDYSVDDKRVHLITFDDTMIESVSKIPFSNDTDAEIVSFTVNFKSAKMITKEQTANTETPNQNSLTQLIKNKVRI